MKGGKACPGVSAMFSAGPNTETRNYRQKVLMFVLKTSGFIPLARKQNLLCSSHTLV